MQTCRTYGDFSPIGIRAKQIDLLDTDIAKSDL